MANSTPNQKSPPAESVRSNRTGLAEISEKKETRDALYLFACHVEWCTKQSLVEYKELLASIDDRLHNKLIQNTHLICSTLLCHL
jgi:hypothetical protein